jgi:hypothetical protein
MSHCDLNSQRTLFGGTYCVLNQSLVFVRVLNYSNATQSTIRTTKSHVGSEGDDGSRMIACGMHMVISRLPRMLYHHRWTCYPQESVKVERLTQVHCIGGYDPSRAEVGWSEPVHHNATAQGRAFEQVDMNSERQRVSVRAERGF